MAKFREQPPKEYKGMPIRGFLPDKEVTVAGIGKGEICIPCAKFLNSLTKADLMQTVLLKTDKGFAVLDEDTVRSLGIDADYIELTSNTYSLLDGVEVKGKTINQENWASLIEVAEKFTRGEVSATQANTQLMGKAEPLPETENDLKEQEQIETDIDEEAARATKIAQKVLQLQSKPWLYKSVADMSKEEREKHWNAAKRGEVLAKAPETKPETEPETEPAPEEDNTDYDLNQLLEIPKNKPAAKSYVEMKGDEADKKWQELKRRAQEQRQ